MIRCVGGKKIRVGGFEPRNVANKILAPGGREFSGDDINLSIRQIYDLFVFVGLQN